ncbi:uncharacterized protein JCM15063_002511 [Sporobolomyces koalae]|uniref:uncharacterized protein n=1 Tax=Sporobolomyces koalae TaxID=500713 RepID=UPI00317107F7
MAVRTRSSSSTGHSMGNSLPPDLFVLVRPPPSHSTHPLNLQIQLLVPSIARHPQSQQPGGEPRKSEEYSRSSSQNGSIAEESVKVGTPGSIGTGNSAVSFDAIAGASVSRSGSRSSDTHDDTQHLQVNRAANTSGELLTRTSSGGSSRSRRSTNSTSVRSDTTTSGTSSRRRVTPLLNLNFHSVLPTVVTDAGTDQRVAKFLKRGIELSSLAIIDPIDLSQPPPLAPTTSTLSAASPRSSPPRPTPKTLTPSSSSTPTNSIFSKFKRFTLGNAQASPKSSGQHEQTLPTSTSSSSFSLFARSTSTSSNLSSASTPQSSPTKFLPSLVNPEGAPTPRTVPLLRSGSDEPAPSATSPTSANFTNHSTGRALPVGYAFIVRKWLRDDLVRVSEPGGIPGTNTLVRLEWIRASDQEYRRMAPNKRTRSRSRTNRSGESGSRRSSDFEGIPAAVPEESEGSRASSARPSTEQERHETGEDEEDEGESSDPEDSERPFICTLFYPSSTSSSSFTSMPTGLTAADSLPESSSMQPSPSLRRLQLATLRPAPHHPKLISTLLLPPTLPSIPLGSFDPAQGLQGGVLSNETLRDLVHVTAMWLAIREGLGGLSREKDPQNIASGLGLVKVKSSKVGRTLRGLRG